MRRNVILRRNLMQHSAGGEHTGLQLILSGEESQRGQRLQAYFAILNQRVRRLSRSIKQTREEVTTQKPS